MQPDRFHAPLKSQFPYLVWAVDKAEAERVL